MATGQVIDKPKLFTLRAQGKQEEGVRTVCKMRQFEIVADEPPALGGADTGPNPMEYVLASLIGCASVMLRMIATEKGLEYDGADFDIKGVLDVRGLEGVPGVRRDFQKVTGIVRVATTDEAKLAEVAEAVEDRCPVFNMMAQAGVDIDVQWEAV